MKEEAEKNAEEDAKTKELIEVKNKADALIYTTEKSVKDAGDKLSKEVSAEVEAKVKELKEVMEKGEKEEIEKKTDELSTVLQKVGEAMSQQTPPTEETPKETDKNEKKTDVEEGEVVN
jgi:molecular chaperone DnaK